RDVHGVGVAGLAQPAPEVARAGQLRIALPDHLQLSSGLDRVVLLRRHDGNEVVELDDLRAGDVLDRVLVDRERDVVLRRVRAGAAGPNPARVNHAGDAHVLDVGVLAGDLVRDVDPRGIGADDLVLRHGLGDALTRRGRGLG